MTDEEIIQEIQTIQRFNYTLAPEEVFNRAIAGIRKPKGKWIKTGNYGEVNDDIIREYMCDNCEALSYFRTSGSKIISGEQCPHCGAVMDKK